MKEIQKLKHEIEALKDSHLFMAEQIDNLIDIVELMPLDMLEAIRYFHQKIGSIENRLGLQ